MAGAWCLYLLECEDGSLYTGITNDLERRFALHRSGKGARYTRSHPPKRIVACKDFPDRSTASVAEHEVKRLDPEGKRAFCRAHPYAR
jgi:putative endonuclease